MKRYIEERVMEIARYMINTGTTVRNAAGKFNVSKSTVHKDVSERLMKINPVMAKQVGDILTINKSERHIRGGEATKRKYETD